MNYLISTLAIVSAVALCALIVRGVLATRLTIAAGWQHFFDGFKFSPENFYNQVEEAIKAREITGFDVDRRSFVTSHALSSKRAYLRVSQWEYIYYVCAAPFGTGTFVSWRLCVRDERILNRIPILSKLLGKDRRNKTFYQIDTESMWSSAIHGAVLEVIEKIGTPNGVRLSESERQYATS